MKKILMLVLLGASALAHAQDITGRWRTIDDDTHQPKAVVQITQSGNTYSGRIIQLLGNTPNRCSGCSGVEKDGPIINKVILRGLRSDGDGKYVDGKIFDPKSGRSYSSKATLMNGGNSLEVRGYVLGIPALGRAQVWQRIQ